MEECNKVSMRDQYLNTFKAFCKGNLDKHTMNIETMLNNGVGVAEHGDFIGTITSEMESVAKWDEMLTMADKHFLMDNNIYNG